MKSKFGIVFLVMFFVADLSCQIVKYTDASGLTVYLYDPVVARSLNETHPVVSSLAKGFYFASIHNISEDTVQELDLASSKNRYQDLESKYNQQDAQTDGQQPSEDQKKLIDKHTLLRAMPERKYNMAKLAFLQRTRNAQQQTSDK